MNVVAVYSKQSATKKTGGYGTAKGESASFQISMNLFRVAFKCIYLMYLPAKISNRYL